MEYYLMLLHYLLRLLAEIVAFLLLLQELLFGTLQH